MFDLTAGLYFNFYNINSTWTYIINWRIPQPPSDFVSGSITGFKVSPHRLINITPLTLVQGTWFQGDASPTYISRSPRWRMYEVILEPGIGQFREFEPPRVHTRMNSWGLFLVHNLTCGKSARAWVSNNTRWKIDEQWDCWTLCAIKIEGNKRGGEGTTPVTTACPEAGRK